MMQAPEKYIFNSEGKKTQQAFCVAYFVDALQVPGNLESNTPPLVQILQNHLKREGWTLFSDDCLTKYTTQVKQLLLELINASNYHTSPDASSLKHWT